MSPRTVSTANSGMPWAWADDRGAGVARAAPAPGRRRERPWTRRRAGRASGATRLRPVPNPGRVCSSSGRANDQHEDRQVAGPVDEVVEEVEQPGVRVLGVLDHEHDRLDRGHPLEEEPPAGEQLLLRQRDRRGRPGTGRRAGVPAGCRRTRARPGRSRTVRRRSASFAAADLGEVVLRDAEPLAHHLGQRPERHALAVREAAAAVPAHDAGEAVDVLVELPAQPGLPDPGRAGDERPAAGRRRSTAAWNSSLIEPHLGVRGRSAAPPARRPAGRRRRRPRHAVARHSCSGSALPLSRARPRRRTRSRRRSAGGSCRRPGPGRASAADCTRAAVLTASPATMPSLRARRS